MKYWLSSIYLCPDYSCMLFLPSPQNIVYPRKALYSITSTLSYLSPIHSAIWHMSYTVTVRPVIKPFSTNQSTQSLQISLVLSHLDCLFFFGVCPPAALSSTEKMCTVPWSLDTQMREESGLKLMQNMCALLAPRRSSWSWSPVVVSNTRINVPCKQNRWI